jgi:hypothetical protein
MEMTEVYFRSVEENHKKVVTLAAGFVSERAEPCSTKI